MMGHKICFDGEIWLIIPKLSLLPHLICSNVKIHEIGDTQLYPIWPLFLKERICTNISKCTEKGCKNENGRVASIEGIQLKIGHLCPYL